ncbi:MAG: PQQ-binding-like beta-propeller repeat protein, partial [Chromatiales bacterium]|nr:PQQ-binding-like beta-propeller repeat protein [Chromatiales bacterium]
MKQIALILLSLLLVACSGGIDPVEPPSELTGFKPELRLLPNWSQSVGNGSGGKYLRLQPLLDGEQIVVADHFGLVRAFDAVNGERLWQMDLGRTINAGAGYAEGVLLFGGDAEVFAIERSSGRLRWSQEISSEVLAAPVAEGDTIVVHAVDGSISALNRHDGAILWRHHENVPSLTLRGTSRPLIVNGSRVVVGGAAGQVVALELQSGNLLWSSAVATARGRTDLERMVDVDAE